MVRSGGGSVKTAITLTAIMDFQTRDGGAYQVVRLPWGEGGCLPRGYEYDSTRLFVAVKEERRVRVPVGRPRRRNNPGRP